MNRRKVEQKNRRTEEQKNKRELKRRRTGVQKEKRKKNQQTFFISTILSLNCVLYSVKTV
jgi:hypothetical protein